MRTVDNFVNGYGLTWNVAERVQAYTHPLWMFLLFPIYFVLREPFYTFLIRHRRHGAFHAVSIRATLDGSAYCGFVAFAFVDLPPG